MTTRHSTSRESCRSHTTTSGSVFSTDTSRATGTAPSFASVSPLNALNGAFSNKAITDSQGKVLLANPTPGQIGNLGLKWVEGPAALGLDMNLIKRVRITESKEFEFRVDAVNVLNHPVFGNPETNINSLSFGRITTAAGNRRFTIGARVNF